MKEQHFLKKLDQEQNAEKRVEMAKEFVDTASQPYFLLNKDKYLSIFYANKEFYHIFDTDSETFANLYQNAFTYTLTYQEQEKQEQSMMRKLEESQNYQDEIEVITASGGQKLLFFKVIQRKLDETGEKLLGYFIPKEDELLPQFA